MKIIERYLISQSLKTFAFGLALFSTVLIISKVQELLSLILNKGISPYIILKLLFFLMPALLSIAIPMSFILGVILSIGRLTEGKEILAMKTMGIGKWQIIKPYFAFSLLLIIFNMFFNVFLVPESNKMYVKTLFNTMTKKVQLIINEKEFNTIGRNVVLYTEEYDCHNNDLKGVNLRLKENDGTLFLFAKKGKFYSDPDNYQYSFIMQNGSFSKELRTGSFFKGEYDELSVNLDLSSSINNNEITNFDRRSLGLKELRKRISMESNPMMKRKLQVELYKKFSLPLAILSLFGLSFYLALEIKVGSRAIGIFASIVLIFGYYLVMLVGFSFGEKGTLPPLLAVNLPNIIFGVPSIWGLFRS